MRALIQRVARAAVHVDGDLVSEIGPGLLVLLGVHTSDREWEAHRVAEKIAHLRVFPDDAGQMNRSVLDIGGEVMVVSQFTLYGDTRRGRRPSFIEAARPEIAEPLVNDVTDRLDALGITTASGVFGAHMDLELTNDGPVTLWIDLVAAE
ncbi:MAG: D-aminoacyl-tRNA deacylase [Actinomycetota bacterium]